MQRSKVDTLDDLFLHFRRNEHGFVEFLTAMDYTVTHSVDLFQVFDATDLRIHQFLQNQFNTYRVLRHGFFKFHFLSIRQFHQQERIRQTDFLNSALRHYFFALHLKELVLDTTATAV